MQTHYTVRFNDCDPLGHLNNSRYIDYMLNAREDHLSQHYNIELTDFHKKGYGWVVTNHEIQYLRPAAYNEKICIQSDLVEAGESHLLVEMRMFNETRSVLKALLWTKFTCINIKTARKERHPADFMKIANEMLVEGIRIREGMKVRLTDLLNAKSEA